MRVHYVVFLLLAVVVVVVQAKGVQLDDTYEFIKTQKRSCSLLDEKRKQLKQVDDSLEEYNVLVKANSFLSQDFNMVSQFGKNFIEEYNQGLVTSITEMNALKNLLNVQVSGLQRVCSSIKGSCDEYRKSNFTKSGMYMLKIKDQHVNAYCDMETMGGGWTLIMMASDSSKYVYDHHVWTDKKLDKDTSALLETIDVNNNVDYVSPAFYELKGSESRLAMSSLEFSNSWSHPFDTARNLVNQPMMNSQENTLETCAPQTNCGSQPINKMPLGVSKGLVSGLIAGTFRRFGYVNSKSLSPFGWGGSTRVGFSGDNNGSDSNDTFFGIGLACTNDCAKYSTSVAGNPHNTGSGWYAYSGWSTNQPKLDSPARAWLWIR